jgi:putative SOS response-associated peptidase YedK
MAFMSGRDPENGNSHITFQLKDQAPFAFAGIWDEWRDRTRIRSCAIITSIANELLAPIHNRMPVILHPES